MDPTAAYAWATAGYLALQSSVQILAPGLLTSLLVSSDSTANHTLTSLETYFSRSAGFAGLALGVVVLLLTGAIPLGGGSNSGIATTGDENETGGVDTPLAMPTTLVTTLYHFATAFDLYAGGIGVRAKMNGFGASAGMIISGGLFCFGVWVVLFGGEAGRFSKRTGADKRTSGFPFVNRESAREKKKASKRL